MSGENDVRRIIESMKEKSMKDGWPHRYVRFPLGDRRIRRGDDFAGDAWLDLQNEEIVYSVVGHDRNTTAT